MSRDVRMRLSLYGHSMEVINSDGKESRKEAMVDKFRVPIDKETVKWMKGYNKKID